VDNDGRSYFANEFEGSPVRPGHGDLEDLPPHHPCSARCPPERYLWRLGGGSCEPGHENQQVENTAMVAFPKSGFTRQPGPRRGVGTAVHGRRQPASPCRRYAHPDHFDLKTRKFVWPGKIDVDGCYGAVCARDHTVYFSCYALSRGEKDKAGQDIRRPVLVRYDPPRSLEGLN
jgi:hypothetical protein